MKEQDEEGSIAYNAARINGGGIFVKDGNVLMYHGNITDNKASGGVGGGIYVNAENANEKVVMLSGAIESNHAHTSGGGMAAQSGSDHNITVQIGTADVHPKLDLNKRTFTAFQYGADEFESHDHSSCPVISGNQAGISGGAFYLNSPGSTFQFFCLKETGNKVKDVKSNGLKVEGGDVSISSETGGNIDMKGSVMVQGGSVDVYGTMKNPYFHGQITVDIQSTDNNHYLDHRSQEKGNNIEYKVQYNENFTGTDCNLGQKHVYGDVLSECSAWGYLFRYYAKSACTVGEVYTVPENQYLCTGYRFQGWNTKMDGTGKSYNTAESGQDGLSQENGATIKLYAQWSKCEHNAANLTYRINKNETGLIQTCSCGAHTAEVTLQTVDQVYDKKEHPVTLRYSGDTWSQAIPDIQYEWRKAGTNDAYTSVNGNPKLAGQYQVTMTAPLGSSASETGTCMFTYKSTEEQK